MGDYEPITKGLRETIMRNTNLSAYGLEQLATACNAVDAIHKALEDANAEMREFCNRLEDAAKKREDVTIFGTDYMALLLDADGVPIHVGDMMHGTCPSGKYVCGEVSAIGNNKFWLCNVQFSLCPDYMRHYYKPTVADVLQEFADVIHKDIMSDSLSDRDAIIERFAKRLQLADGDANE